MKTKSNEWREVLVDIDTTSQNKFSEGDLRYVIAPGRTPALTYCSVRIMLLRMRWMVMIVVR
jgi:hypothetical protein